MDYVGKLVGYFRVMYVHLSTFAITKQNNQHLNLPDMSLWLVSYSFSEQYFPIKVTIAYILGKVCCTHLL